MKKSLLLSLIFVTGINFLKGQNELTISFDVDLLEMPSFASESIIQLNKNEIVNAVFFAKERSYFFVTYGSKQGWLPSTTVIYNSGYYSSKELITTEDSTILADLENVVSLKSREIELEERDRRELQQRLKDSKEERLFISVSSGDLEDCDNYLQEFPNGKYKAEVERIRLSRVEYRDYQLAINGTIEDCDKFISDYPSSKFLDQVRSSKDDKIEYAEFKKASRGSIEDCRIYLNKYPNGAYRESIVQWKERLETIATSRNVDTWTLGDRICTEDNPGGIIQGVIEQWNENKSKVKIKILGGYEGMYKGEDIFKGNMIWVSPEGWYKCIGDELINYEIPSVMSGGAVYDRNTYKYTVGDRVECRNWANGDSGYDGVVLDKRDGKYLVKVTKVIVSGWFSTNLNPSDCSGNVRLMYTRDRLEDEGEGSIIWVSKECVE
jgi:hypothetical protein